MNPWYGVNLGVHLTGDKTRLERELDDLKSLGVNNHRVMATSERPDDAPWRIHADGGTNMRLKLFVNMRH